MRLVVGADHVGRDRRDWFSAVLCLTATRYRIRIHAIAPLQDRGLHRERKWCSLPQRAQAQKAAGAAREYGHIHVLNPAQTADIDAADAINRHVMVLASAKTPCRRLI
jgi:hypothetical protein